MGAQASRLKDLAKLIHQARKSKNGQWQAHVQTFIELVPDTQRLEFDNKDLLEDLIAIYDAEQNKENALSLFPAFNRLLNVKVREWNMYFFPALAFLRPFSLPRSCMSRFQKRRTAASFAASMPWPLRRLASRSKPS